MKKMDKGFTLVEIMIVLVILGILSAVLVPSMSGFVLHAQNKSLNTECYTCVVGAQTLAKEKFVLGLDGNDISLTRLDEMVSLPGNVKLAEANTTTKKISHLVYESGDKVVTYCAYPDTCSIHSETYTYEAYTGSGEPPETPTPTPETPTPTPETPTPTPETPTPTPETPTPTPETPTPAPETPTPEPAPGVVVKDNQDNEYTIETDNNWSGVMTEVSSGQYVNLQAGQLLTDDTGTYIMACWNIGISGSTEHSNQTLAEFASKYPNDLIRIDTNTVILTDSDIKQYYQNNGNQKTWDPDNLPKRGMIRYSGGKYYVAISNVGAYETATSGNWVEVKIR